MSFLWMECLLVRATYFTAPWCAPCKAFKPFVTAFMSEQEIQLDFVDVDVDPAMAGAQEPPVMTLPTVIFYGDDGKGLKGGRVNGASEKALRNVVSFLTAEGN